MEIELKLASPDDALDIFERSVLPLLKGEITREEHQLFNEYFDTPDQLLGQRKIGFRIRVKNEEIEQTVKTKGSVEGGLHQRPEYNIELQEAKPDLTKFDADIWAPDFDVEAINQQLVSMFTTNFRRVTFDLINGDDHIEIVFDQGDVKNQSGRLPISEIEIELKKGDPSALFDIADQISQFIAVRLSNTTKASRGYQLVTGNLPETKNLPKFLRLNETHTTEEALCLAIQTALKHWQHHEHVYLQSGHLRALHRIAESIELLLQSVSLYLPVLQCMELLFLHKQLLTLHEQWRWQEDLVCIRKLRSRKGPFSRKIPKSQMLMSYLNGRREGLLAVQSPENLLASRESILVQLSASRILVEKPWRQQVMSYDSLVLEHAKGWLSQGYQTVMQSLPKKQAMDHHNYLALEMLLRTTLINGFLLAELFVESRGKFRAPWLDLLTGLKEIKSLVFLNEVLKEVEVNDVEDLDDWIKEKLKSVITVMERSRKVAMSADVYW
ncbi:inorganic triphosphatase [Glaciecola sp. KUL10]|uniref:CYTH domain-containing protein n=1 Tax=Glaciecola sp. (strain KUL10) TaxID=2161813 RepID=UPI000D789861|nr:CYTH domain-containing protein [Glaciecola sp. KUL10]GBL05130.1 hypothetical protein KUL10_24500 [Glaciecola sp. KUL10]